MSSAGSTFEGGRRAIPAMAPPLFLSLSVLLHLAVFLLLFQSPQIIVPGSLGSRSANAPLHLVLHKEAAPAKTAPKAPPKPVAHSAKAGGKHAAPEHVRRDAQQARRQPRIAAVDKPAEKQAPKTEQVTRTVDDGTPSRKPSPPTQSQKSQARAEVLSVVQADLARHFLYPMLARRRGWEGTVVVAFRVDADGRIGNPRIARSSGIGVLDRAAVRSLRRIEQLSGVKGTLGGHSLDLELPVIYRLQQG